MKTLKTLKDLDEARFDGFLTDEPLGKGVGIIELKEAAREWVKELQEHPEKYVDTYSEWVEGNIKPNSFLVNSFIKHFFNLEEDTNE